MSKKMSRDLLLSWFKNRKTALVEKNGQQIFGVIQSLEHEDGSGYSFNVEILDDYGQTHVVYVRTTE